MHDFDSSDVVGIAAGAGDRRAEFPARGHSDRDGDSMNPVHKMRELFQQQFSLSADQIGPEQCLADLGIDSLSAIEFMFLLEDKFDICLAEERGEFRTVADMENMVLRALSMRSATA